MLGQAALRDGSLQMQAYVGLVGARGFEAAIAASAKQTCGSLW
jgi:hypothetical protein